MGLFAENAEVAQALAEGSCWTGLTADLDTDQKPPTAHFVHVWGRDLTELLHEVRAQLRTAVNQILIDDNPQGRTGNGAAQRVATEG